MASPMPFQLVSRVRCGGPLQRPAGGCLYHGSDKFGVVCVFFSRFRGSKDQFIADFADE